MRRVLDRLAHFVGTVIGAMLLLFVLGHLLPGDPATALLGPNASPETIAAFRHAAGLDLPLWRQILGFFGRTLHGDLGVSLASGRPVASIIAD
ncbi:MAG TPA: ABC transporter permease, partial [Stellaceae bacterium]|nr:ABC transporter permease [Stellaceae bacterium]